MRLLASAILTGALLVAGGATGAQTPMTIRVAALPIGNSGEAFYAVDQGFFKAAGIDAQVTILPNGGAVTGALVGGSYDVGVASIISASLAHEKGLQLKIVAPGALYESRAPSVVCAVAKNSPITTAKELEGKVFGVPDLGGLPKVAISEWMQRNGGDPSKVQLVEVPFAAMVPALQTGRIDASILIQPLLQRALDAGQVRVLSKCFDAVEPQFAIAEFYSTAEYAAAHAETLKRFSSAIQQAGRWANAHPDEAAAIVQRWTKASPWPSDAPHPFYAERLNPKDFQPQIDAAARWKVLSSSFPVTDLFARE